jgi:3-isopropylmalate dehydrogenase
VHGSAPDIAGKMIANPMAAILSGALLARYAWHLLDEASRIENSVKATLEQGVGVAASTSVNVYTTDAITQNVIKHLKESQ